MLYLNQTELATQEDIDNDLIYWAKIFKATDWDELRKLCSESDTFREVAQVMYKSNVQSQEKTYMEAHEKYLLDKLSVDNALRKRDKEISLLTEEVTSLSNEVSSLTSANSSLNTENAKLLALLKQNGFSEEQIASYLAN